MLDNFVFVEVNKNNSWDTLLEHKYKNEYLQHNIQLTNAVISKRDKQIFQTEISFPLTKAPKQRMKETTQKLLQKLVCISSCLPSWALCSYYSFQTQKGTLVQHFFFLNEC